MPNALEELRPPVTGARGWRSAGVASVAMSVPRGVVANGSIAERLGVSESWIASRTGIRERRVTGPGETLTSLATDAGRAALERAGVAPEAVDLVLVATLSQDDLMPNAAPLVAGRLGARHAGAIDVGAACTGFIAALSLGVAQIESGRAATVLVVGADRISPFVDADDRTTAPLFGDGAGAAVLTANTDAGRVGPVVLGAASDGAGCLTAARSDAKIRMRGPETFRVALLRLAEATRAVAERARRTLDEIDLFVYHQGNARLLDALARRLGLPRDKVVYSVDGYGNTSAASVPIALCTAGEAGALHDGALVLVAAVGAGITWGAALIEWGSGS